MLTLYSTHSSCFKYSVAFQDQYFMIQKAEKRIYTYTPCRSFRDGVFDSQLWKMCGLRSLPLLPWERTTVMLMASSNWCMRMLITADANSSRMRGSLNWRERFIISRVVSHHVWWQQFLHCGLTGEWHHNTGLILGLKTFLEGCEWQLKHTGTKVCVNNNNSPRTVAAQSGLIFL